MTEIEFTYLFSKLLFTQIVNETIFIENWEGGDFDDRYLEYLDMFNEYKSKCLHLNEGQFKDLIDEKVKILTGNLYTTMKKQLIERISKERKLSTEDLEYIIKTLEEKIDFSQINFDFLKTMRKIEEKFL